MKRIEIIVESEEEADSILELLRDASEEMVIEFAFDVSVKDIQE
jgi:hypothetical protein